MEDVSDPVDLLHGVPPLAFCQPLPWLGVPRVPHPNTGSSTCEAPHSQQFPVEDQFKFHLLDLSDIPGPCFTAVRANFLFSAVEVEQLPLLLHLSLVAQVGEQPLVTTLPTVATDLVAKNHPHLQNNYSHIGQTIQFKLAQPQQN